MQSLNTMNLLAASTPMLTGTAALAFGVLLGAVFGLLLNRGGVTDYNVIVRQFLFKDFTVLKVMLTAIVVGGVGVLVLYGLGLASYEIKSADLLAVGIGAAIFGVGMVVYGYCPGTAVAAIGTGSVHALVGAIGMLVGGILYAYSFPWLKGNVLSVASYGKIRLPDITGIHDVVWFIALALIAGIVFYMIRRLEAKRSTAQA